MASKVMIATGEASRPSHQRKRHFPFSSCCSLLFHEGTFLSRKMLASPPIISSSLLMFSSPSFLSFLLLSLSLFVSLPGLFLYGSSHDLRQDFSSISSSSSTTPSSSSLLFLQNPPSSPLLKNDIVSSSTSPLSQEVVFPSPDEFSHGDLDSPAYHAEAAEPPSIVGSSPKASSLDSLSPSFSSSLASLSGSTDQDDARHAASFSHLEKKKSLSSSLSTASTFSSSLEEDQEGEQSHSPERYSLGDFKDGSSDSFSEEMSSSSLQDSYTDLGEEEDDSMGEYDWAQDISDGFDSSQSTQVVPQVRKNEGGETANEKEILSALQMSYIFQTVEKKDRKLILKALKAMARKSFHNAKNYILTQSYIASLTERNPFFRAIGRTTEEKQKIIVAVSKKISKSQPKKLKGRIREVTRVLTVLRKALGLGKSIPSTDRYLLACTAHLVEDIRRKRHEGYWTFLDGLQHNALLALFSVVYGTLLERETGLHKVLLDQTSSIKTCLSWSTSVGRLPVLNLLQLPGGLFGSILSVILKGYNYMFFPALAAMTNIVSLGLGFLCVTRIPMLFMKIYDKISKAIQKGIRSAFIKRYKTLIGKDSTGIKAIELLGMNEAAVLLSKLWQLRNVKYPALSDFRKIYPTVSENVFVHGVNYGAAEFSSSLSYFLKHEFLSLQAEDEKRRCYTPRQLTEAEWFACSTGPWKTLDRFSDGAIRMIGFVSHTNFKSYVAEVLLLMYNIANVNLLVSPGKESSTAQGFGAAKRHLDVESSAGALPAQLFRLPFLRTDAHQISMGFTKLAFFFELRRLHRWTSVTEDREDRETHQIVPPVPASPLSLPADEPSLSRAPPRRNRSVSSTITTSASEETDDDRVSSLMKGTKEDEGDFVYVPSPSPPHGLSYSVTPGYVSRYEKPVDLPAVPDADVRPPSFASLQEQKETFSALGEGEEARRRPQGGRRSSPSQDSLDQVDVPSPDSVPSPSSLFLPDVQEMRESRAERDLYMKRLFYDGLNLISKGLKGIIGRFIHLVLIRNGGTSQAPTPSSSIHACPRHTEDLPRAGVCENGAILRAKDEMPLRLLVNVFAGIYMQLHTDLSQPDGEDKRKKKKESEDVNGRGSEEDDLLPFGPRTPEMIADEFMKFIDEFKLLRAPRPRNFISRIRWKRRQPWILQAALQPLFFNEHQAQSRIDMEYAVSGVNLTRIREIVYSEVQGLFRHTADSARFKHSRCDTSGKIFLLTDLSGSTALFTTNKRRDAVVEAATCRLEYETQEVEIVYRRNFSSMSTDPRRAGEGVLLFPDETEVEGVLTKDTSLLSPAESDADTLLLIEGILWLKGYPRVHAKMIASVLFAAKRLRYEKDSWRVMMEKLRPHDIEYSFRVLQEKTSDELSEDLRKLGKTSFIGFDFSAENIWSILLGAAEKAIMPLKKQAFLSADFNIVVGASLLLQTYQSLTRRVTGLTQWYRRFQDLTYREFQALNEKRRRLRTRKMAKTQSVEDTLSGGGGDGRSLASAEERERKERYQRLAQEVSEVSSYGNEEEEEDEGRGLDSNGSARGDEGRDIAGNFGSSPPLFSVSGTDGDDESSFIMLGQEPSQEGEGGEKLLSSLDEERKLSLLQFGRFMKIGRRERPSAKTGREGEAREEMVEGGTEPPLDVPSPLEGPRRVSIHTHRDAGGDLGGEGGGGRRRSRERREDEEREGDTIAPEIGVPRGIEEKEREREQISPGEESANGISSSSTTTRRKRGSSSSSTSLSSTVNIENTDDEKPVERSLTTLDWDCESLYENLRPGTYIKGAASITPAERNAIQCSLLHFLKREPKPTRESSESLHVNSGSVMRYLDRIVLELRFVKGEKNRRPWDVFLNAFPERHVDPLKESQEEIRVIKKTFQKVYGRLRRKFANARQKIRSELSKKFLGRRWLNRMRGDRFLQVLLLAYTETFPNPANYPEHLLFTPMEMFQFCGLQTLLRTQVSPYLHNLSKGRAFIMQMKAAPVPSPTHKRLLAALDRRLHALKEEDQKNHTHVALQVVRQIAGYLRMLSQTTYTKVEMPEYVSRAFMKYSAMKLRSPPSQKATEASLPSTATTGEGQDQGLPLTEEDFLTVLQMHITDVELFHTILSSFDDVKQLRSIQSRLSTTEETFISTLRSAEQHRLYSVFYFYGLAQGRAGPSYSGAPLSMLGATLECKSLVPSSIATASRASAEDFRAFLQANLSPGDSQEIVWADILPQEELEERKGWFSSLWSKGSRRATARRQSMAPRSMGLKADETKPWRMMLKLPLLSALEVLGIHSQFRVVLPRTRGLSPAVLCGLAEPSGTDFALPLGLPEWTKLRKDSREESYFISEERDLEEEEVSGRSRASTMDLFSPPSATMSSSPPLDEASQGPSPQAPASLVMPSYQHPAPSLDTGDRAIGMLPSPSFIDTTDFASSRSTTPLSPEKMALAQVEDRQKDEEFVIAESSISPDLDQPVSGEQNEPTGNAVGNDTSRVNERRGIRGYSSSSVDPIGEPVDTPSSISLPSPSRPVGSPSLSLAPPTHSNEGDLPVEDDDDAFTSAEEQLPSRAEIDTSTPPALSPTIPTTGGSTPSAVLGPSLSLTPTPTTTATSEGGEEIDTMVSTTSPFALGTSILPLFLDFFHGLSVLTEPMKGKGKKLESLIEKKLDRRYLEFYIQERGKPTSRLRGILSSALSIVGGGRMIRRTRRDRLLPEEYEAIFRRATSPFTGGEKRGPLSASTFLKTHNNPLLSLVFRDLLGLLRKTRRLAEKENVAYVASWVCVNSIMKICDQLNKKKACLQPPSARREESPSCDGEALIEQRKQACIRDMSERCQSRAWKEHQLVLYTEEQAIKEGIFLATMRALQPRDIRAILETIDEAFIDEIWSHVRWMIEDKRRIDLSSPSPGIESSAPSERQRKRRLYFKGKVLSALKTLEKSHPHFAVPVIRDLIRSFFFNLIDGRYASPESLRGAIGGIRWAAARAAGVEYDETILSSMKDLEAETSPTGSIVNRALPPTPPPSRAGGRLEEEGGDLERSLVSPSPVLGDENIERREKERDTIEAIREGGLGEQEGRIGMEETSDRSALLQQRASKKEEKTQEKEFKETSSSSSSLLLHEQKDLSFLEIEDPSSSPRTSDVVAPPASISSRLTQLWRQRAFPLTRFQKLEKEGEARRRRERQDLREVARNLLAPTKREDEEGGEGRPPMREGDRGSPVREKFGRQVEIEMFHEFAFHVAARREGMLKWLRPYRINPYQLVLDVLLTVQSGFGFKMRAFFSRIQSVMRGLKFRTSTLISLFERRSPYLVETKL